MRLRLEIGEIGDGALRERGRLEDHPARSVEVGTNETSAIFGSGAWLGAGAEDDAKLILMIEEKHGN